MEHFLKKYLSKYSEQSYTFIRVASGLLFLFHGIQKVFGILSDFQPTFLSQLWIGGLIEVIAGLFIILGFKTRLSAFLSSGMMLVAYIQFHWKFQFDSLFFPAINKGELALVYSILFFFIACKGAGKCALDSKES